MDRTNVTGTTNCMRSFAGQISKHVVLGWTFFSYDLPATCRCATHSICTLSRIADNTIQRRSRAGTIRVSPSDAVVAVIKSLSLTKLPCRARLALRRTRCVVVVAPRCAHFMSQYHGAWLISELRQKNKKSTTTLSLEDVHWQLVDAMLPAY